MAQYAPNRPFDAKVLPDAFDTNEASEGEEELDEEEEELVELDGQYECVWFTFAQDLLDFFVGKIKQWFAHDEDMTIVDFGHTDKLHRGYMVLEFGGYGLDNALLQALHKDERILDYSFFIREEEEEED